MSEDVTKQLLILLGTIVTAAAAVISALIAAKAGPFSEKQRIERPREASRLKTALVALILIGLGALAASFVLAYHDGRWPFAGGQPTQEASEQATEDVIPSTTDLPAPATSEAPVATTDVPIVNGSTAASADWELEPDAELTIDTRNLKVTVVNDTGRQIVRLFAVSTAQPLNDHDWLGSDILASGAKMQIDFKEGNDECVLDIKVRYDDGTESILDHQDVCELDAIHFRD